MEKIQKTYNKLNDAEITSLVKILSADNEEIKKNRDPIINNILTYNGIDLLLSSLSKKALKVFYHSVLQENGATYSEIEKSIAMPVEHIEESSKEINKKLLGHIIKNRKLLTNKFDKLKIFDPLTEIINPYNINDIQKRIGNITNLFYDPPASSQKTSKPDKKYHLLLENIFQQGGLISINEFRRLDSENNSEKLLKELLENEYIDIVHFFSENFFTLIILNDNIINFFIQNKHIEDKISVNNSFSFFNNFLYSFDVVSTYGLFLTRLNEFRKNDYKRISSNLIKIKNMGGFNIPEDQTAQLILYFSSIISCVSIHKDEITFDIEPVKDIIKNPYALCRTFLNAIKETNKDSHSIFTSPFKMPQYNSITLIYNILNKIKELDKEILKTLFILLKCNEHEESIDNIAYYRKFFTDEFNYAFRLMIIFGIIELKHGLANLTSYGKEILVNESVADEHNFTFDEIYINPDFTIMIPYQETPAEILYIIQAYTEIINTDVVIHTKITRESILHAFKRGMKPDFFINYLAKYAKNEMPQNLDFLIKEWITQTLKLTIKHVTLLKSNKPEFIEELMNNKIFSEGIHEKISDNYLIIDKSIVDEIIREAKKQDAMINLLGEL